MEYPRVSLVSLSAASSKPAHGALLHGSTASSSGGDWESAAVRALTLGLSHALSMTTASCLAEPATDVAELGMGVVNMAEMLQANRLGEAEL